MVVVMLKKHKKLFFYLMIVIIFLLMYILNNKTLFVSDDYTYHFIFNGRTPTADTKFITNPIDIIYSMINHWNLWGGRVSVHFLLQLVLSYGFVFFNIVNSIMFVLIGILIYKHIVPANNKEINLPIYIFIYAMLFLFVPQPASTIMWKSGAANYLWSCVLILCMTLVYKRHYEDENLIKDNTKNSILLFLYGFVVGCANENTGCALIIMQIIFAFVYKYKYKKIPKWVYTSLISTIISYIILVIAPGNYIRADIMYEKVDFSIIGLFGKALTLTKLTVDYLKIPVIFAVISSVTIFNGKEKFKVMIEKYGLQIIYLIFVLISIYSLLASPAFPERCWFFAFIFLLIICGLNINYADLKNTFVIKALTSFLIIISIFGLSEYGSEYYFIDQSYKELTEQLNSIVEQRDHGIKDVEVHQIYNHKGKYNAFAENGYLSANPKAWFNQWMAKYYNVNSITALE